MLVRDVEAGGCRPPQRPPRRAGIGLATLTLVTLAGCGDVSGGKAPATRAPDADISPARVELDGTCGATPAAVRVTNRGNAPLQVDALSLAGTGWAFAPGETGAPSTLAPGASREVPLLATDGEATLTVATDDPERPRVVVTLRASADAPPTLVWTSPAEEAALPEGDDVTLQALVGDAETPADALAVTWTLALAGADPGGDLATTIPDAGGRASWVWPAGSRPAGPLVLQARAVDLCGNVGENSVHVCQDGAWRVPALTYDAWRTEGAAVVDPSAGTLDLGPDGGAAFDATTTFDGDRLAVTLRFAGAGDTLALIARDGARTTAWGGGPFGADSLPGWALLLDPAPGGVDPCGSAPALAWVVDGAVDAPATCVELPRVDDGAPHALALTLEGGRARVTLDGAPVLDAAVPGAWSGEATVGIAGRGPWRVDALEAVDHTCPR